MACEHFGSKRVGSLEAFAAAGVAVGGFYQHFTSKRQLLLVLMDRLLQDVAGLSWEAKGTVPADLRDGITRLIRQALTVDWAYAGAYRAWHEAAVQDLELQELYHQIEAWSASQLTLLFRKKRWPELEDGTIFIGHSEVLWRGSG